MIPPSKRDLLKGAAAILAASFCKPTPVHASQSRQEPPDAGAEGDTHSMPASWHGKEQVAIYSIEGSHCSISRDRIICSQA